MDGATAVTPREKLPSASPGVPTMMGRLRQLLRNRAQRETVYSRPEFWESKATDYQDSAISMFPNRSLNKLLERDQFAFIDSAIPDVAGAHMLDVGAGTGRLSRHLARRGATVTSFDFAPAVVDIARHLNRDLPIEAGVLSVFDLEAEAAYDHATVLGCLTTACRSADDLANAARRLHRALRPGALVAMVEPFHRGFLHRVLDLSPDEVIGVLENSGFALTRRAAFHCWPVRFVLSPLEVPGFLTRPAYAVGEAALRLLPSPQRWSDYTGLALRRKDDAS